MEPLLPMELPMGDLPVDRAERLKRIREIRQQHASFALADESDGGCPSLPQSSSTTTAQEKKKNTPPSSPHEEQQQQHQHQQLTDSSATSPPLLNKSKVRGRPKGREGGRGQEHPCMDELIG